MSETDSENSLMHAKDAVRLARQLFTVSPLKQRKLQMLRAYMDNPLGKRSLDVGSDNGVISLFLRDLGGEWSSADLIPETVEAIRELVGERVSLVGEAQFPYQDASFDQILIVDFLEHIEADKDCIKELARILAGGGSLIVNVPNPKEGLLRKIRYAIGQTDQMHGHLRPGYSLVQLEELLQPDFEIQQSCSYGRLFSELIDTVIVGGLDLMKGGTGGKKGRVVSASDLKKREKSFKIYRLIAPLLHLCMMADRMIPWAHGNMLIVRAKRRGLP